MARHDDTPSDATYGPVLAAVRRLLDGAGVVYEEGRHEPVRTAADAAAARGCPIEIGAKSIVLKTDDTFRLFVLSGDAVLRSRLIRKHLGVRRTRFATAAELRRLTGLAPGAVPPFGRPVLPLELYVDRDLLGQPRIAFTPGVHTVSIIMATEDYRRIAAPRVFPFAAPRTDRPAAGAAEEDER